MAVIFQVGQLVKTVEILPVFHGDLFTSHPFQSYRLISDAPSFAFQFLAFS